MQIHIKPLFLALSFLIAHFAFAENEDELEYYTMPAVSSEEGEEIAVGEGIAKLPFDENLESSQVDEGVDHGYCQYAEYGEPESSPDQFLGDVRKFEIDDVPNYEVHYEYGQNPEFLKNQQKKGYDIKYDNMFVDNPEVDPTQEYQDPDCPTRYFRYEPEWYNTWKCEYEKRYSYKRHCRQVPKYYQKRCCVYVPQYYYVTRCIYVPEYYYTTKCYSAPQLICLPRCKYVRRYYYKSDCPEQIETPCDVCETRSY